MKKLLTLFGLISLFAISMASDFCPKPEEIFSYNYLGFNVFRAPNYLSRWYYDEDIQVDQFFHVEADSSEVNDCWYLAHHKDSGKAAMVTLSPLDQIIPDLSLPSWKELDKNYYICDGEDASQCPLN